MHNAAIKEAIEIINLLLTEISSELDLHYEDEDFVHLRPTIDRMKESALWVQTQGGALPDAYHHVLRRFNRHHN